MPQKPLPMRPFKSAAVAQSISLKRGSRFLKSLSEKWMPAGYLDGGYAGPREDVFYLKGSVNRCGLPNLSASFAGALTACRTLPDLPASRACRRRLCNHKQLADGEPFIFGF
ncbi:hypothetical protein [Phyllobacterium sp. UNC302MFCol5.2]|uniref:hypothetical protein n=1 Tax=Phyllobacterium sp. UNC302MFCol5.2 TaxID=1449065 RepID=UPI0012DC345C|nr:hypothetical protein [Phyllobacterium sp. UNC302MFCol5.2]